MELSALDKSLHAWWKSTHLIKVSSADKNLSTG